MVVAFRLWGHYWEKSQVTIHCDNMAVVQVIQSGKTRNKVLGTCIRNLWLIAASRDIKIEIQHIAGVNNVIADCLSRRFGTGLNNSLAENLNSNFIWDKVPTELLTLESFI